MRFATRSPLGLSLAALAVLAAGSAFAFAPQEESRSLEFPLPAERRLQSDRTVSLDDFEFGRSASIGHGWQARHDLLSGHVLMAWGGNYRLSESGVANERSAEALAATFLEANDELLGTRPDNLEVRNVKRARGKYVAHFQQKVGGLTVWKSDAYVLMGEDGRLMSFGSNFFPEDGLIEHATLSATDAIAAAAHDLGAEARTDLPIVTEQYLVAAEAGELLELTPAWRVVFESETPFGKWESFVHGQTGEVLSRRNHYHPVNVVGNVGGSVDNQPPTYAWCDGEGPEVLARANVSVSGGGTGVTDVNGDFDITHGGTADVSVTTSFQGPFINVNRFTGLGADASLTQTFTPGTPGTFDWNDGNARQDERDCFYHGNLAHDFITGIDPGIGTLDYSMPTVVGRTDGFCPGNAWWDGLGINFCEQGASGGVTYYNTGTMANVVYHEYGHGVTQEVYQNNGSPEPPSGLHEGNSDVIANFIDRNSVIGFGFSSSTGCGSGIRNADNGLTYPSNNENGGHTAGQVIAGFHWLAWQNMLASLSQAEADNTAFDTWHFARDMGTPQTFPAQVLWTFMMDDDDANLDNGTPHYDYFCPAATAKGFTCPEILVGVLINHDRLGHVTGAGGSDYDVVATIVSTAAALDPSLLQLHWRVDGGAYQTVLLSATGNPDEFSASIPALPKDGQVEYYISAEDVLGNSRNDPPTAPGTAYAFDVCSVYEDAEGDISGWSLGVGGDTATTGIWERVDPIGTAAQPEDDTTTGAGTQCFVTGQCSGALCSGGCTLGCNDIDGGTTTLLSPVWDMTGKVNVKVKFEHWYSNNTGAEPNADNWVIDISNDGGSSWTNVLNTAANFAWTTDLVDVDILFGTPGQIRLRFIASDLAGGSVVEAAVDDVRILAETQATDAPVIGGGTVASVVTLDAAQPNPFRETTNLAFALPQRADVSLRVYNVQGQMVRELVHGVQDAGRHVAEWDGRDSAGNRVATGVYFYRLDANERTLTRKMTVMK